MSANYGLAFLGLAAGFTAFFSLIGIVAYILLAVGLYNLGKRQNIEYSWLAWIPVAQLYVMGALIKEMKVGDITIPRLELVLPIAAIVVPMVTVPFIGWLIGIAYYVFMIYAHYLLFKLYVPNEAVLYTILSALGLFPIFVFVIRNKEQVGVI